MRIVLYIVFALFGLLVGCAMPGPRHAWQPYYAPYYGIAGGLLAGGVADFLNRKLWD
jgi:hypothetical protein